MKWTRLLAVVVALPLMARAARAQAPATGRISGTVTENVGGQAVPVSDANVVVVGTTLGARTGDDGRYTIGGVPAGTHRVRAARIGFSPRELTVTVVEGQTATLDFQLGRVAITLDQVVTIGYGTQRRADLTGSVATVQPATQQIPTVSMEQILQGRAAGVNVTTASAAPGGGMSIRIRGGSSINGGNEPLYVIDGIIVENDMEATSPGDAGRSGTVPFNPLASINPEDIESIDILKDASSTAIYGARGANGVVIITTKRGRAGGRPQVTIDTYTGVQSVAHRYDLLDARGFALFANEWAGAQATPDTIFTQADITALGKGTDWQSQIFRSAPVRNLQIGITGGTAGDNVTRYALSGGIFDQQGVVVGSAFRRVSLRGNLDQSIGSRLRVQSNLLLSRVNTNAIPTDGTSGTNTGAGAVSAALQYYPVLPVRRPDGTWTLMSVDAPTGLSGNNVPNPVSMARDVQDRLGDTRVLANVFGDYELLTGLRLKISGSADYAARSRDTYYPSTTLPGLPGGEARRGTADNLSLLNENTLSYDRDFGSAHQVSAVVGYSRQSIDTRRSNMLNSEFISDVLGYEAIGTGLRPGGPSISTPHSQSRFVSYFGRVNYTLLDRYIFTVTERRDGSSRFGPGSKWGTFPSAAFAWKLSDESFMRGLPGLDLLKLRVSTGEAGNPSIGPYQSMAVLTTSKYALGGTPVIAFFPSSLGNPDLKWESTREVDVGSDVALLGDRVNLTLDYYSKRTNNLLLSKLLPPDVGFGTVLVNAGGVKNAGFEAALNLDVLRGARAGGVSWTTSFNYAQNRNKVTDLAGDTMIVAIQSAADLKINGSVIRPGQPLGVFYGYVTGGILRDSAEAADYTNQVKAVSGSAWSPGDRRILDLNGDSVINEADRTVIGNPAPKFTLGWLNTFNWRALEVSAMLEGSYGGKLLNMNLARLESGSPGGNILADRWYDRWTPENPDAKYPRIGAAAPFLGSDITSDMLEDGSYTRLRTVTLAFTPPAAWVRRSGLSLARVYVTGTNLITWTDYSGFNPDVSSLGVGNVNRGIDIGAYPLAKAVTVGFNLSY